MNDGQMKIDNKIRRVDVIIPTRRIDESFVSEAQSEYEKKKQAAKREIYEQINRVMTT